MQGITHRSFVSYIDRTREFYAAQGYDTPYAWARNADVPFAKLAKPLARCRVALITTASPWRDDKPVDGVLRGGKEVWSGPTDAPPERLFTDDLAWDKEATHTRDVESFLPIRRLQELAAQGRIGSVAPRFHGVPTDYSQRRTVEQDAPEILARCREDAVDVALLVPLCPVCHQTVSLVSRHLEANGIATVVIGAARDIVEECGVARFLFSDFPLGNPCGKPYDAAMQRAIVGHALDLLESARLPRTTVQTPFRWSDDETWKDNYARLDPARIEALRLAGERRRAQQQSAKDGGRARSS